MFQAKSTFTILDDILYLDLGEELEEPAMSQLTHCIRALKPAIDCTAEDFGVDTTTAALIAIAVNMATECADRAIIANALCRNAEILDVEAQVSPIGGAA